jgi:hypothetical protein
MNAVLAVVMVTGEHCLLWKWWIYEMYTNNFMYNIGQSVAVTLIKIFTEGHGTNNV